MISRKIPDRLEEFYKDGGKSALLMMMHWELRAAFSTRQST